MPEIPEQLKWYMPLRIRNAHSGPLLAAWRVSVNDMTSCVEIKRSPLVQLPVVLVAVAVAFLYVCSFVVCFVLPNDDPESQRALMHFLLQFLLQFLPILIVLLVSIDAGCTIRNSRYWKGPLRFRYNSQNGELFFPRENITYRREDYSKLVLGCVRGHEVQWIAQFFGVRWTRKRGVPFMKSTQIFMLVLGQDDEWKRYNLTDDEYRVFSTWKSNESGSKQFMQLADMLGQHLVFERFVKSYSRDECAEQQR